MAALRNTQRWVAFGMNEGEIEKLKGEQHVLLTIANSSGRTKRSAAAGLTRDLKGTSSTWNREGQR